MGLLNNIAWPAFPTNLPNRGYMNNRACILLLFAFSPLPCEAQDVEEKACRPLCSYLLLAEVPVYECNITGAKKDTIVKVAEASSLFTVIRKTAEDSLIIRFHEWKDNKLLNARLCYSDSLNSVRRYFLVAESDLTGRLREHFERNTTFTAGTVIIPFKLRVQKFDFSKDVTLGPAIAARFRLSCYKEHFVNLMGGLGITSVTLDRNTTGGMTEESTEVPALTPSLGFVFELNKTVQTGLFCGWDYVSHNDKFNFIYHGKTWISIGLGYTLISFGEEK